MANSKKITYREMKLRQKEDLRAKRIVLLNPIGQIKHAWHLFIIMLDTSKLTITRDKFIELMKKENIGTGIHFASSSRILQKYVWAQKRRLP